jgi:hypothetical protein
MLNLNESKKDLDLRYREKIKILVTLYKVLHLKIRLDPVLRVMIIKTIWTNLI